MAFEWCSEAAWVTLARGGLLGYRAAMDVGQQASWFQLTLAWGGIFPGFGAAMDGGGRMRSV